MKKVLSAALAGALIAAAMAVPALAKDSKPKKGKKAIGTVVSFDATSGTLVADMRNGSTYTGQVSPDAKIKLEHRGKPAAKGNATKGSLDDLVAGATLLKVKRSDGVVRRIHLRALGSTVVDHPGSGGGCKTDDSEDTDSEDGDSEETDDSGTDDSSDTTEGDSLVDDVTEVVEETVVTGASTDDTAAVEETESTEDTDSTEPDPEDCLDPDNGSGDDSADDAEEAEGDGSSDDTADDSEDGLVEEVVDEVVEVVEEVATP